MAVISLKLSEALDAQLTEQAQCRRLSLPVKVGQKLEARAAVPPRPLPAAANCRSSGASRSG